MARPRNNHRTNPASSVAVATEAAISQVGRSSFDSGTLQTFPEVMTQELRGQALGGRGG